MLRLLSSMAVLLSLTMLLGACSSPKKNNSPTAIPPLSVPVATGSPVVSTPARAATAIPTATPSNLAFPPSTATVASGSPTTGSATVAPASGTPAAATPAPGASAPVPPPPPPPPPPPGSGRGGSDSAGGTLPVGVLCPLGFPVKGDSDQRAHEESEPGYQAIIPVACFKTLEDAITAGYTAARG